MKTTFQESIEALYGLERRRDKLGLDGTRALLASLGDPQSEWASVHVAGTNGKGSVCALIERVLRAANVCTGLFTSPHLVDFRERIRVDGEWADEVRLARRLALIQKMKDGQGRTFFEVCTALAFDDFAARGVEWGVVEVGLGGRLDCTTVLEPTLTVITSVGLDHTELLGDTLEQVAAEKAGIVKPEVPLVSAIEEPAAARVIEKAAAGCDAPLVLATERAAVVLQTAGPGGLRFAAAAEPWGTLELETGFRGRHQLENARTALAALSALAESGVEIPADAVREGFAEARWPGRLEPCPAEPRLWWDGAHNADGFRALARAWREDLGFEPPAAVVLALSRDKDALAIARVVKEFVPAARLLVTRSRNERAMPAEDLARCASTAGLAPEAAPDVRRALEAALAGGGGQVLLAGSLFAVGEAMEAWGGAPGEWL
ncbi:MAG: bifunctional folylpolyglutamate synthase/dihydrofolate synthase [Candidatus Eisenbacteria bacterium]|nr:bifunctional folylpolyglutamate synthase/dihydrofolate synthase [Candidatus Eisenbacteria bacterium]